ncbi:hypothetical protein TKK_0011566 [Trichogramma kaykai]
MRPTSREISGGGKRDSERSKLDTGDLSTAKNKSSVSSGPVHTHKKSVAFRRPESDVITPRVSEECAADVCSLSQREDDVSQLWEISDELHALFSDSDIDEAHNSFVSSGEVDLEPSRCEVVASIASPGDDDQVEVINLAALRSENRNFVTVTIVDEPCVALFDPGATSCSIRARLAEKFHNELKPCRTIIRLANGSLTKALGMINLAISIGGKTLIMPCKAMAELEHDVLFEMNFFISFDVDVRYGRRLWRANEGQWNKFQSTEDLADPVVTAKCAGLCTLEPEQNAAVDKLVEKLIAEVQKPGKTSLIEHHIRVKDDVPVKLKLRRMSPMMWSIANEIVIKWEKNGIIERSASDYCSAPVLVKKQNSSEYRMCIDFCELNKKTIKDAYPMPSLDTVLDKLRKARYISKIDLKAAYNQIPMERSSRRYTAFAVAGSGLWQFRRMPFGLVNAPMTWSRLVDHLFGPEFEPHVFYYLDDIIIVTVDFSEHLSWIERVLKRLIEAGLEINRDKCEFCCSRVTYLGYLLNKDGLRVDPEKLGPIVKYPTPSNIKQLRRFLGVIEISRGLGGEEQQEAFDTLKRALTTVPILARPNFNKPFTIQCDASATALGAVLVQDDDKGDEHPIVYLSRVLNSAERNYSTSEKECLAILWSIKKLRPYIEGYKFTVVTDHSALTWLRNLKDPTGRLARWALELQQWDFIIVHRKGALMHLPDALSRMFEPNEDVAAAAELLSDMKDPWYLRMLADVKKSPKKFQNWTIVDGRLYRFRSDPLFDPIENAEERWKLVIPAEYREQILADAHSLPSSGHLGVDKTYDRIARDYYWKGFYYDTLKYIQQCRICQQYKYIQRGPQGLIGSRVVERPWVIVAADLMEFPPSKSQHKFLVVFQDLFTRWIEVKPLRRADGKSVARAFEELILFRWETPRYFLSDNGKEFINKVVADTLESYGVKHVTTPPYHPQANAVERCNRILKAMISSFVGNDHRDWDLHVHEFRHAVNTAVQATTKVSPAFLNFGRHPTPVKSLRRTMEGNPDIVRIKPEDWLDRLRRLNALKDLVARHIDTAKAKQEKTYNAGRRDVQYFVRDAVLRRAHVLSDASKKISAKLHQKYEGPFIITEKLSPTVFNLSPLEGDSRRISKVHVSELK